ncbi:MAG: hypothetical protein H7A43_07680 [Verrucomicrobia bacterium]|nr:hypothetical protein [Verrucomicrobiota bacterium]
MGGESQSGFVVGQRWMSEAEPELGLGVVLEVDGRQVVVQFPAADEQRRYAIAQAPLKRVLFRAGESVTDGEDRTFTIVSVEERDGLLIYHGSVGAVPESGLQDRLTQDRPYERLFTGSADDPGIFALRRETLERRFALEQSPVRGFIGGKVELIPHQFYIAREVSRRVRPRVLLADEVGLADERDRYLFHR